MILPTIATGFNAKEFFLYVDISCNQKLNAVNEAGDDMNALVEAALDSFNWTQLSKVTFLSFWGKIVVDRTRNSAIVKYNYEKLGSKMDRAKYSIYCDGSAFSYVKTGQEGDIKNKPWSDGKGRW